MSDDEEKPELWGTGKYAGRNQRRWQGSEPVEPPAPIHIHQTYHLVEGMTLRDWLAGQAAIGLCAFGRLKPDDIARDAYLVADAMTRRRSNES